MCITLDQRLFQWIWVFLFVVSLCIASLLKSLHDFFFPKLNLHQDPLPFLSSETSTGSAHPSPTSNPYFEIYTPSTANPHSPNRLSPGHLHLRELPRPPGLGAKRSRFADRPAALPASRVMSSNQRTSIRAPMARPGVSSAAISRPRFSTLPG
ncbi:hypothetical protein CK203_109291 [Vitis vinifera]|uniref:Uncharacterized protein n=1 Tax=Vitis vinifera TaxID=29760 RepID=A0A438CEH7_VITVI|nr:hypothetical protein CK203_109291 [Vitis vinifera]